MAFNLQLDINNDIIIGRGTARVEGMAYTVQLCKNKLLTVLGEWKANKTLGLPWFDDIMIKAPDMALVEGLFLNAIKQTPHVLDVLSIDLNLDHGTRVLTVTFTALSNWGVFDSSASVPVGSN